MNLTNFAISFFILIFCVFSIATSSIAIECYQTSDLRNKKQGNWIFIITNLVAAILFSLLAMRSMYRSYIEVDFQS
jgi:hypothetical protein